jgi:hypothetical protein
LRLMSATASSAVKNFSSAEYKSPISNLLRGSTIQTPCSVRTDGASENLLKGTGGTSPKVVNVQPDPLEP